MKIFLQVIVFFSLIIPDVFCQQNDITLNNAIRLGYNFKFDEALSILNNQAIIDADNPKVFLFIAKIYVWQYLSDNKESSFNYFKKYADITVDKSNELLKKNKDVKLANYCLYNIKGYRTLIYLLEHRYIDGIWNAKDCLSSTLNYLEENKNDYDAYLWKGLFNFALSQVPSTFKYLLSLTGLKGDFIQGINELEIAATKSNFNIVESKYFLSQILSLYLDDFSSAERILKELNILYPNNLLIAYSLASEKIKLNEPEAAKQILINIDNRKSEYIKINNLAKFLLGDVYFFIGDYNLSIKYYKEFLAGKINEEYHPIALFRLGLINEFQKNYDDARYYFSLCQNKTPQNEEAEYYIYKSKYFSIRNLTNNELRIFQIENLLKSGNYNNAKINLDEFVEKYNDKTSKINADYLLGLLYLYQNQSIIAEKYFYKCINETDGNSWIKYFSHFYVAKINYWNNKYQNSLKHLEEIDDNDSDFFNKSLKLKSKYYFSKLRGK